MFVNDVVDKETHSSPPNSPLINHSHILASYSYKLVQLHTQTVTLTTSSNVNIPLTSIYETILNTIRQETV